MNVILVKDQYLVPYSLPKYSIYQLNSKGANIWTHFVFDTGHL